jgi:hypothetical protein
MCRLITQGRGEEVDTVEYCQSRPVEAIWEKVFRYFVPPIAPRLRMVAGLDTCNDIDGSVAPSFLQMSRWFTA